MPNQTLEALLRASPRLRLRIQQLRRRRLPRILPPDQAERWYMRELLEQVDRMEHLVMPGLEPLLDKATAEVRALRPDRADSWANELAQYLVRQQIGFGQTVEAPESLANRAALMIANLNAAEIKKLTRAIFGVDLLAAEPWLKGQLDSFSVTNVNLIKSLGNETYSKIQTMAQQGVANGRLGRDIAKDIRQQFGASRSRAALIARDQVAKLNGNLTQLRQQGLGIEQYRWRTSNDERVRATHKAHNGVIYSWNDPPANTGHPGQDYQCRCWAEPILPDL